MAIDKKNKPVDLKKEVIKVEELAPTDANVTLFAAAANEKEAKKEAKKPPKN